MLLPYSHTLSKKKIVLASASPRRKYALQELGLSFSVVPSTFAEDLDKSKFNDAADYVSKTAQLKTLDVLDKLNKSGQEYDILIGADSVVVLNGNILEKPNSVDHAKQMLASLSGNQHSVITAVCIILYQPNLAPKMVEFYEKTDVWFSQLSEKMIDAYVATGTPMDKAGGYGIQEVIGGSFVESIKGCYYNVTGFPVNKFCREMVSILESFSNPE